MASVAGGLQAAAAPPDDGLAASVVPVDTPVKFAALATENDLRETVLAGVAAPFAVVAGMDHAPADQLLLHPKEDVLRDDGLVVAFHIVLRDGVVVFDALLRQKICDVSLLQERVTDVLLVEEDLVDSAGVTFCLASAGEDTVSHKPVCNLIHTKGKNRCVSRQKHALINSRERPRKSDINLEQSSHVDDKNACVMKSIPEEPVKAACATMMNKLTWGRSRVLLPYVEMLKEGMKTDTLDRLSKLESLLEKNAERRAQITQFFTKGLLDPAVYAEESDTLVEEAQRLTNEQNLLTAQVSGSHERQETLEQLLKYTAKGRTLTEFDDALFTEQVDHIVVYKRTEIGFAMKCGAVFRERI